MSGAGRGIWGLPADPRRFSSGPCYLIPANHTRWSRLQCTQANIGQSAFILIIPADTGKPSRSCRTHALLTWRLSSHITRHLPQSRSAFNDPFRAAPLPVSSSFPRSHLRAPPPHRISPESDTARQPPGIVTRYGRSSKQMTCIWTDGAQATSQPSITSSLPGRPS